MAFRTPVDEWWCGTDPGAIDSLFLWRSSSSYRVSSECYVVRIAIHLLRRDGCGGNALTMSDIPTILSILAEHFEPHGIRFYLVSVDTICNTYYYNGWQSPWGVNEVNGAINLYLSGSDALSYGIGGIASGIPGKYLWVGGREDGTALSLSPVVSHEMGHCLGLFHTFHGLCERGSCRELVNGSNCSECGDYVCDTPADPTTFNENSLCRWTGRTCKQDVDSVDANGDRYRPNLELIMAYVRLSCMKYLTAGQGERMREHLANSGLLRGVTIPEVVVIDGDTIASGNTRVEEAAGRIEVVNSVVEPGGRMLLKACRAITFKAGAHLQKGAIAHAYIDRGLCCPTTEGIVAQSVQQVKVDAREEEISLMLWPQPAAESLELRIAATGLIERVEIFDVFGRRVAVLPSSQYVVDVRAYPSGTYIARVWTSRGMVSKAFLVMR